jgi:hypothetical protein
MADNYGGNEGLLRAQDAIPRSQRESALVDIEAKYKDARNRYRGARTQAERNRAEADMQGAEAMKNKVTHWEVGQ